MKNVFLERLLKFFPTHLKQYVAVTYRRYIIPKNRKLTDLSTNCRMDIAICSCSYVPSSVPATLILYKISILNMSLTVY